MERILFVTLVVCLSFSFFSTAEEDSDYMQWWKEARFGLFVHWSPISLLGREISWSRGLPRMGEEYATWDRSVPSDIYDYLYTIYNPVKFDAKQWVQMMQDAGMKYIVFTTKHHDGFVNFDSQYTDYKITGEKCPFGRDIVKELADACHESGIKLGFYYSPPDWHHPEYLGPDHDTKYIEYFHGQVEELCKNYGKVDIFWFDGLRGTAEDWHAEELILKMRKWQPGIIINNRLGVPGDLGTPEQTVGSFTRYRPWESCITITDSGWSWNPDGKAKSFKESLHLLLNTSGGDGNLLFNMGPKYDGTFEPDEVAVVKQIGKWLDEYGHTIYATRGGPFMPGDYGVSTCKDRNIFVHITEFDGDSVVLGDLPARIVEAKVLTGGECSYERVDEGLKITVAKEYQNDLDTIVQLTIDKQAIELEPIEPVTKPTKEHGNGHGGGGEIQTEKAPTPDDQIIRDDSKNLVFVGAGTFPYRSKETHLDAYLIQKYEVTNYQFSVFLNNSDNAGKHWHSAMDIEKVTEEGKDVYKARAGFENYPVVFVAIEEANAYADYMSKKTGLKYTLPSEAQWEKAAGWDPIKKHFYDYAIQTDEIEPEKFACSTSIKYSQDVPGGYAAIAVGSYDEFSYYGCYDMSGNVREWTTDTLDGENIMKGGSYWNYHTSCRSFSRVTMPADAAGGDRGFRLVVEVD